MSDLAEFDEVDLGAFYHGARLRLSALVSEAPDPDAPVPCCPGWSVHDVLAHVVAVAEDALAERLTGPPSPDYTSAQVAARRHKSVGDLVGEWEQVAEPIETSVREYRIWPAALDALAHEHDVRGALGRPAGRDGEDVAIGGTFLLTTFRPPTPMVVRCGGRSFDVGSGGGDPLELDTDPFEAFRFRLGRRSRAQLANMRWTGDPEEVLDALTIFGPSPLDIVE